MIAVVLMLLDLIDPSDRFVYRPPRPAEVWIAVDEYDPEFRWQLHTLRQDLWRPFPLRLKSVPDIGLARQLLKLERRRLALHQLIRFHLVTSDRLDEYRISSRGLPKYRIDSGNWRRFPVDPRLCGTVRAIAFFEAFADELYRREALIAWRAAVCRADYINRQLSYEDGRTVGEIQEEWIQNQRWIHSWYDYGDDPPQVVPRPRKPLRRPCPIPWQINPPVRTDPPPVPRSKSR